MRLFELGTVYRYERAGTLHGLMRIRGFTQDDSHIFCTEDQVAGRDRLAARVRHVGAAGVRLRRVRGEPVDQGPQKYVGSDENWEKATEALRAALEPTACRTRSRRVTPRSTARRSTSTSATPSAARGSCRPSRSTSTIPSGSSSSTSAPTTPAIGRSCCTGRCSVRSSGSSACWSSTTPARSRYGSPRCRCACCRLRDGARGATPPRSSTGWRRRLPGRRGRCQRSARQADPQRQAGEDPVRAGGRRRRRRRRHGRGQPARRRGRARRAARGVRRPACTPRSTLNSPSPESGPRHQRRGTDNIRSSNRIAGSASHTARREPGADVVAVAAQVRRSPAGCRRGRRPAGDRSAPVCPSCTSTL